MSDNKRYVIDDESELFHIKLVTGEDLVAYMELADNDMVMLVHPVLFTNSPEQGLYLSHWLYLSQHNYSLMPIGNIIRFDVASKRGKQLFENFVYKKDKEDMGEDVLSAMKESKVSTRH